MAFTDKKSMRTRGGGVAGVIIVHAGLAALLLTGLAVGDFIAPNDQRIVAFPVADPPPPPDPTPKQQPSEADSTLVAPRPKEELADPFPFKVDPVDPLFSSDEIRLLPLPPLGPVGAPKFGADIAATPRNNAASWVTDNDYRTPWINRGFSGLASFQLEISATGRVEDCRITRSSGHAELDQATCSLISKRARFNPAKDASGRTVTGSYSGSINWILPD